MYASQSDSADWIRLSTVNYGHTHPLFKKEPASFIFQGNKTQQKTKRDIIVLEGSDPERGSGDEADSFSLWDV